MDTVEVCLTSFKNDPFAFSEVCGKLNVFDFNIRGHILALTRSNKEMCFYVRNVFSFDT